MICYKFSPVEVPTIKKKAHHNWLDKLSMIFSPSPRHIYVLMNHSQFTETQSETKTVPDREHRISTR